MEKPLLPAVVTNEPETPIPDQSLNRAVRHVENLRGPDFPALKRRIQNLFHDRYG